MIQLYTILDWHEHSYIHCSKFGRYILTLPSGTSPTRGLSGNKRLRRNEIEIAERKSRAGKLLEIQTQNCE